MNAKPKTSNKFNILMASTVVTVLMIGTFVGSVSAYSNYATHDLIKSTGAVYPVTPEIYGVKANYKVEDTTIASGTVLVTPTWATLDSPGKYREVGWSDQGSENIHSYYAIDGQKKTPVYFGISDGTAYNWEVSNTNEDYTWDMVAPGLTKTVTSFTVTDAIAINVGFEFSHSSITLPTVTFNSQRVYVDGTWELWDDQDNGLVGDSVTSGHYVLECIANYKSEHGEGSGPASC